MSRNKVIDKLCKEIQQPIFETSFNSVTNKLLLVFDKSILEYDCKLQKREWKFNYFDAVARDYLSIPWNTKHA